MNLKGTFLGMRDLLSMMGFFGFLKLAVFSATLLAQTSGTAEAIQVEQVDQGARITRLEDRQGTLELIRNFEYGALAVIGGFIIWFLKETAKNTNKIAAMGATQGHHDSAIKSIGEKLDRLIAR